MAVFGPYTLDVLTGELRKFGVRVKIGEQPFQILLLLLERDGQMVTREELRVLLWGETTHVDFDHSLNSAVQRLRESLCDSAGHARWIETVPRRGYRFRSGVEWKENAEIGKPPALRNAISRPAPPEPAPPQSRHVDGTNFRRRWTMLALCLLLLVGLAAAYRARSSEPRPSSGSIHSLAVLPLENLSGDPAQDSLADDLTNQLTTLLAKDASIRVVSHDSVLRYKHVQRSLPEIARELGVDAIVEGSVVRTGDQMRITAQFLHGPTDTHLWAESYVRSVSQTDSVLKEVARNIAASVDVRLATKTDHALP